MTSNLIAVTAKLRHIRQQWGMSPQDLAEILHVHERTIFKWESREQPPTVDQFFRWANALGCDLGVEVRK